MAEEAYYQSEETVAEYIQAAEGYDGSYLIAELNKWLSAGAKVLELGSGPGKDWELLGKTYSVIGSDFSPAFLRRLAHIHPEGEFLHLDAGTLETDQTFGGIYSNKVLHHLQDDALTNSFQRQFELLEPGGVICHSFWRGEGEEYFKGMYVNYHTDAEITQLMEGKFELLLLQQYKEFEDDDSLLCIARKLGE